MAATQKLLVWLTEQQPADWEFYICHPDPAGVAVGSTFFYVGTCDMNKHRLLSRAGRAGWGIFNACPTPRLENTRLKKGGSWKCSVYIPHWQRHHGSFLATDRCPISSWAVRSWCRDPFFFPAVWEKPQGNLKKKTPKKPRPTDPPSCCRGVYWACLNHWISGFIKYSRHVWND